MLWEWVAVGRNELGLFAATLFLIGAIDEIAIDALFVVLRLRGRISTRRIDDAAINNYNLAGVAAVFIPAWHEHRVIEATVAHAAAVWRHRDVWFFVGCYRNDPETIAAARRAANADPRIQIIIAEVDGPTCKADCLNRLFRALQCQENARAQTARMVVLHDAEDMVDEAALGLLDGAIDDCDFVQLPVLALPQRRSIWIAGHYTDEFCEAHAKTLVVRHAIGGHIPGAGVGCAIGRPMLDRLDAARGGAGPFAAGALTEDYELGLTIGRLGGRSCFLRARTTGGRLIATRAFFPSLRVAAVRQKTRWIHGIALQGWDRLGWSGGPAQLWMQLRDRRGPSAALLLGIAYFLIILGGVETALRLMGMGPAGAVSAELRLLLLLNLLALIWRAAFRFVFTAREFGFLEGILSVPRIVVSNTIAILAGSRALAKYVASLCGGPVVWEKTDHASHPTWEHGRSGKA